MEPVLIYFFLLLFPFLAQIFIVITYSKYKEIKNKKGLSGFEVVRHILDSHGLDSMYIVEVKKSFKDHYDAKQKVIRLSSDVFHGESITALSVAFYEACYAIQDKEGHSWVKMRTFFLPLLSFFIYSSYLLFFVGLCFQMLDAVLLADGFLFVSLLFYFITFPIEIDAYRKALHLIKKEDIVSLEEMEGVERTLKALTLTNVASLFSSLIYLIRSFISYVSRRD